jgi:hypothetical protein
MKLRLPVVFVVFMLFSVRLASAQDFLVYEMKGDTVRGKILKETSENLVMQPATGEKLKVSYHDVRSYSYKGKLYQRRFVSGEANSQNGFVTQLINGKINLYESSSWAPTGFVSTTAAGPGMMPTGGGRMTYYYIDKTGQTGGLRNPVVTGLVSEKRLQAARKMLLELMGDDELVAYKINNGVDFEIRMIRHLVSEYNRRNPVTASE